jgi:branched-chain amino acid transport system permease protein
MAALAGTLYAHYITYIDPTSFTTTESILVISMVIIGGVANLRGPLFGAAFLIAVPEILRFIGTPSTVGAEVRQVALGALIVLVIVFRPQGLFGSRVFGRGR